MQLYRDIPRDLTHVYTKMLTLTTLYVVMLCFFIHIQYVADELVMHLIGEVRADKLCPCTLLPDYGHHATFLLNGELALAVSILA